MGRRRGSQRTARFVYAFGSSRGRLCCWTLKNTIEGQPSPRPRPLPSSLEPLEFVENHQTFPEQSPRPRAHGGEAGGRAPRPALRAPADPRRHAHYHYKAGGRPSPALTPSLPPRTSGGQPLPGRPAAADAAPAPAPALSLGKVPV